MNHNFFKLRNLGPVLCLYRWCSSSRLIFNITRVKALLPNLPPSLREHLSSKSIVSYTSLPSLRAQQHADTGLLKGSQGVYIIT